MGGGSLFQVGVAVEFWRVLVHLSILAFCLVLFEALLHYVEHKLSRYDKYQHMLRKGYRELMILGLLSLGLKVIKEIPGIQADSKTMLAFQVADLAIFILALALILQAITIFSQLRKHNNMGDRTELISAQDLVDSMNPSPAASSATGLRHSSWHLWPEETPSFEKEVVEQRLLRHLFLRRFGLPQLFPFSKYLRRAQANQISHMIEVEPSMWVLLLAVAWAICAFVTILEKFVDLPESRDLVEVFVAFAWILVGLHVAVLFYFQTCMRQILVAAGYSEDNEKLVENLQTIADEEAIAWRNEAADSALDTMNRVQEELEEFEDHLDSRRHVLLQHDTGFQLVATCYRKIKRVGATTKPRETIGVQPETPDINIRYFSRKAWHVVVIFLLMLNGFFIALLIQCAVYNLDEVYGDFGLVPAIMVPLPVLLNTFVFQERMFRYFVTVCSIIRVDASTLGEVVHHFSEIVELRSEFAATLLERLRDGDYSVLDLRAELDAYDTHKTGMIDVDKLRYILAAFGYRLTRFRFNSVAMLLFELRGTKVEYGQLLRLLMVSQAESPRESAQASLRRQHPLLRQSTASFNGGASFRSDRMTALSARQRPLLARTSMEFETRPSDFVILSTPTLPPMNRASISAAVDSQPIMKTPNGGRGPTSVLDRSHSHQFRGSTSRTLHDMFNIQRPSDSRIQVASDDAYTVL